MGFETYTFENYNNNSIAKLSILIFLVIVICQLVYVSGMDLEIIKKIKYNPTYHNIRGSIYFKPLLFILSFTIILILSLTVLSPFYREESLTDSPIHGSPTPSPAPIPGAPIPGIPSQPPIPPVAFTTSPPYPSPPPFAGPRNVFMKVYGVYTLSQTKHLINYYVTSKTKSLDETLIVKSFRNTDTSTEIVFNNDKDNLSIENLDFTNVPYLESVQDIPIDTITPNIGQIDIKNYEYPTTPPPTTRPPPPTSAPTRAPIAPTPIPKTCFDLANWSDSLGNTCDFYKQNTNHCETYGIEQSFASETPDNNGCTGFTTEEDCTSYGVRGNLCTWDGSTCSGKPVTAWDACCSCNGGIFVPDITTAAPTRSPTSAPTPTPTMAPTVPAPVVQTPQEFSILSIQGVSEIDTAPLDSWVVPLYVYKFFGFTNSEAVPTIEKEFLGPMPASLGDWPKLDVSTGRFESFPNVIIDTPSVNVNITGNYDFETEPVPGLDGKYYLFINYSCTNEKSGQTTKYKLPLYTAPLSYSESSKNNPKVNPLYFTNLTAKGEPTSQLFVCYPQSYQCICAEGTTWDTSASYIISTPPNPNPSPIYDYNYPTYPAQEASKQCFMGLNLQQDILVTTMNATTFSSGDPIGENQVQGAMEMVEQWKRAEDMCPGYYSDCRDNATCSAALDAFLAPDATPPPGMTFPPLANAPAMYGEGEPTKDELRNNIEFENMTNDEFFYLNACVEYKVNKKLNEVSRTCEFMDKYLEDCKMTADNINLDELEDGRFLEALYYIFIKFLYEPLCIKSTQGLGQPNLLKESEGAQLSPSAYEQAMFEQLFLNIDARKQIRDQCCK